jgi:hypothetical protein
MKSNPLNLSFSFCNKFLVFKSIFTPFFQCKHQLAARLAASLGACVEVKVSDEQLALLLSKL